MKESVKCIRKVQQILHLLLVSLSLSHNDTIYVKHHWYEKEYIYNVIFLKQLGGLCCTTHPIMDHGLECVFQFFLEPKTLENVDDAKEEQQTLTLHISCRNAARTAMIKGQK